MLAHLRYGAALSQFVDHRLIVHVDGIAQPIRSAGNRTRLAPFHAVADLRDQPRVSQGGAAQHDRVYSAFAHALHRGARIVEIAVADHGNVDGEFEASDVFPVRMAFIKLPRRARVQRHGLYAHPLRALGDVGVDQVVFAPAQAHLHRDGAIDRVDDGSHDLLAPLDVAQARGTAVDLRDFWGGAAEVDVDDVRAAFAHDARGFGHDLRVVAPELRAHGFLEAVLIDHLHRALGARRVLQRVGRDEFGHGQAQTERLVQRAHGAVGHARHRRQNERRPDAVRTDDQGSDGSLRGSHTVGV